MSDDIFELSLNRVPRSGRSESDAEKVACSRPVIVDPMAWSIDGDKYPDAGIVIPGAGRRFGNFYQGGRGFRAWQAVCEGENGVEAKKNAVYFEPDANHGCTWDASALKPYDVLWWGWCLRRQSRVNGDRYFGVVVEISDDRLVIWRQDSLAKAVKSSHRARFAASVNEHAIPVRRRLWDEERALGLHDPVEPIDPDDMEAIEAM